MSLLVVCAALFSVGLYGVLVRRDVIGILASAEIMLGAGSVQLLGLGMAAVKDGGVSTAATTEAIGLLLLVLAAAEASIGLALLLSVARRSGRGRVDELVEVEG